MALFVAYRWLNLSAKTLIRAQNGEPDAQKPVSRAQNGEPDARTDSLPAKPGASADFVPNLYNLPATT